MPDFKQFKLIAPLERAIEEEGYVTPTPIQEQTLPAALEGHDILGCAQTGTGKTAAFLLPILDYLADQDFKPVARRPLVLVLAPTRELAIQIGESCTTYGRYVDVKQSLIYGGVGQSGQVKAVQRGVQIVIATPGRLLDLMQQEHIHLNRLQIFVLDEADRMLDMGFLPDLKRIIRSLPIRRQSMFFSATMPQSISRLAEKLLHHPVRVKINAEQTNVELIDQRVIFVSHRQKKPLLAVLLKANDVGQAIVFTRTKRGANYVAEYLRRDHIEAVAIHGNKSQNARQQALTAFRADKVRVLVATDLAARGIDVEGITHIINFEIPVEPESYVHRIGRTGRAGAHGIAISLCSPDEEGRLKSIERLIGFKLLEDGRTPDPLPESDAKNKSDGGTSPPGNRNRNRRRRRPRTRSPVANVRSDSDSGATESTTADSSRKKTRGKGRRGRRRRPNDGADVK
ncbi:MAG: DEAD/DEAH box helicase [Fuerstiella sp.]|nr:DEAD/DEAH box helicase [Fuerstiella sp.]